MRTRVFAASVAAATALTLAPAAIPANPAALPFAAAEPAPITGVELNVDKQHAVAVDATFDPSAAADVGLPALKKLRAQMWDANPYYNHTQYAGTTRLQDIASAYGLTTKDAYVNAVAIDGALTRISIQRAAEQQATSGLTHTRPDGTRSFTATVDAKGGFAESLSAGRDLEAAILQGWGHGELRALNAARGGWNEDNGHLHMMLNPKYRYYGFGEVTIPGTKYGIYAAAHASDDAVGADYTGEAQRVWLYRAPKPGEAATGIKEGVPGPLRADATLRELSSGDGSSAADAQRIIGIFTALITLFGVIASVAQQLGLV